jgi:serine/threonine protein kinase
MTSLLNQTIKCYTFVDCINANAHGAVYHARQSPSGRDVTVKVILPIISDQPEFIRSFEIEAQRMARLEHPYIVPLYDYWRDPGGAYLVTRWLRRNLRAAVHFRARVGWSWLAGMTVSLGSTMCRRARRCGALQVSRTNT